MESMYLCIIICGFDWPKTLYNTDDVYKINIICFCKTQTESINFINHYKPPFVQKIYPYSNDSFDKL